MPIVELENIRKVYDTKVAVEGLSLVIEPGTMFGLLGPNGSGKTSSIRMMIGMTVPDSGSVSLFGQPFTRTALNRVGYLPEERGLYKKMKVLDQLIFLGQLHGLDEATARKRSISWCERMEITEAIGKKTEELSKGMQQKIQFIAALLHEPELIIMDEPFSGLDPVNAQLLMDTLIELRRQGRAILFSTHRMDQVEKLCDAIAIIFQGKLVLSGSVRDVKSRYPRNRVQAVFSGDDSFLRHAGVLEAKNYSGIAELTLASPEQARAVLAEAVARGTDLRRFEVMEPTLEEIFIDTVKGTPEYVAAGVESMLSSLHNVFLVARREYLERLRAKSFAVMTVLIPLLMGGLLYGSYLANRHGGSMNHIAVVTSDAVFAHDLQAELSGRTETKPVVDVVSPAEPGLRERLNAQQDKHATLDGYLWVRSAANGHGRPTFEWMPRAKADIVGKGTLASAIRATLTRERLLGSGMAAPEVDALMQPVDLDSAGKNAGSSGAAFGSAYGMFFLMYFIILFYGMNVARSIIEEKTSRIFEVLLATIKPGELMAGKVIGVGSVGLTQVGIWIAVALFVVKTQLAGSGVNLLPSGPQIVFFILFFLLGYLLYSSVAAALGAMTSSEQELQQMNIFLMLPLIACSVIIFRVVTDPDSTLAKVFSFIPFCTPLIMYTRIIVHQPPASQIALSLAILIFTIVAVLWVASRIYRVGILMYGKSNLPEILRWLRYS